MRISKKGATFVLLRGLTVCTLIPFPLQLMTSLSPFRPKSLLGALVFSCLATWILPVSLTAGPAEEIRAFTGAQTRVVWIQDAGETACVYSEKPTLRLMGFDTDDGKGERAILPNIGWYAKPVITADGNRVVFADLADHSVKVVNFDGTGLRLIVKNEESYKFNEKAFTDNSVWTDPKSGVTWVYAMIMEQRGGQPVPTIRRYQLDHPEVNEMVWDKTPVFMFMMNGDGRMASGGVSDGGNTPQGVFLLPNVDFAARGGGCWPSMSPDNSLRSWVFTGNHRSIHFCVTTDARTGKGSSYGVEFNKSPGLTVKGQQEMYHPRWSNNVRFFTLGSPFEEWNYKSEAKIPMSVAEKVEIYLGKFTEDMKGVERFVQVTHNTHGDYWASAWIKPPAGPPAWLSSSGPAVAETGNAATKAEPDRTAQVFVWTTGMESNQINNPKTGAIHQCIGLMRDAARLGRNAVMDLTGGAFVPDAIAKPWLDEVQAHKAFAIEAVLTPLATPPSGEGVVLAFADDLETGNVVLSQRGEMLCLRLRGRTGEPLPLVRLPRDHASHVIVSYAPGNLMVLIDGQRVLMANPPEVPVAGWTAQSVIFGDAWKGGHNWPGLMEGIGLFGREISGAEARQRFDAFKERSAARKKSVERVVVEAKLTGTCAAADPLGIAPYKRCLSTQQYEVLKTVEGKLADKMINVAQWSVLDGKVVQDYLQYKAGQVYRLALERWEDHPEQESERMISGNFEEKDLFYQVREISAPAASPTPTSAAKPTPDASASAWSPVAGQANQRRLTAPVFISGQDKPTLFSAQPGMQLDAAGQDIIFENGSLSEVTNSAVLRLGGAGTVTVGAAVTGGARYTSAPALKLNGGGGQGAVVEATMGVTELELTHLGSGYTSVPTVTIGAPDIYGGRQATAVAYINKDSHALSQVRVTDAGSGYLRSPRVTFEGGEGSGAEAQALLSVTGVIVTRGGSGYTTPPTTTLTGDGQEAMVQPVLQRTVLRFTDPQGSAILRNTGTIDQDGAVIFFDWAASQDNYTDRRGFENTGTWVLRNSALIQFGSSTGRRIWGAKVNNYGTLRLLGGARIALQSLQNSGTLQLANSAVLGYVEGSQGEGLLTNTGQALVIGGDMQNPVAFGFAHPESTGNRSVVNGSPDGVAKARFAIGDGKTTTAFRVLGGQVEFTNHPGSSMMILPGATLSLITNDNGSRHMFNNRRALLTNAGDLTLAGALQVQGNHAGMTGLSNKGRLTIQGAQAGVERLPSSAGLGAGYKPEFNCSQLLNFAEGVMQGTGTFTYTNHTGNPDSSYLRLYNLGSMSPGGDQPGQLIFANVNVQLGGNIQPPEDKKAVPVQGAGILRILIAGPANFSSLQVTGDEGSGRFDLADGNANTLNVVTPMGIVPHGKYRIVTAKAVKGTFAALQFNGKSPAPYTVNYLPDGIEVVFR